MTMYALSYSTVCRDISCCMHEYICVRLHRGRTNTPLDFSAELPVKWTFASVLNFSGYEMKRQFYALYATTSGSQNDRPFPIYIIGRGDSALVTENDVFVCKVADEPCRGDVVGRPERISDYYIDSTTQRVVIVAE